MAASSMLLRLVPALVAFCLVPEVKSCAQGCTCTGSNITHCSNLTGVPSDIPEATTSLYIVQSSLKVLPEGSFARLENLKTLTLVDCQIESIQLNAFSGLIKLTSLKIQRNKISTLQKFVFSGLTSLVKLELQNNDIQVIEDSAFHGLSLSQLNLEGNPGLDQISDNAFRQSGVEILKFYNSSITGRSVGALGALSSSLRELWLQKNRVPLELPASMFEGFTLRELNFNHNGISNSDFLENIECSKKLSLVGNPVGPIDFSHFPGLQQIQELMLKETGFYEVKESYFRGLTHLRRLDLSDNGITSLHEALRPMFNQLEWLSLENNRLHCNCELVWLKRWAMANDDVDIECTTPRAEDITEYDEAYMSCSPPSIMPGFRSNWNVSLQSSVQLTCIAEGDPAPTIEWLPIPNATKLIVAPPSDKSVFLNQATFHIGEMTKAFEGVYTCHAYNPAGNVSAAVTLVSYMGQYNVVDTTTHDMAARTPATLSILILSLLLVKLMI